MLARTAVIALNAYREAVRARILHGLFALALATGAYALIVGAYALRRNVRVVSDVGAASISLYAIVVAVVLAATSLYRELELKTLFPILARPLSRTEYVVGKYLGILLTLATFVAADAGLTLLSLGYLGGRALPVCAGLGLGLSLGALLIGFRFPRYASYVPIPWGLLLLLSGWFVASPLPDDRWVVVGLALLALLEVAIVAAIAMVFSAFSSPFLTAVLTFCLFLVGRSADTLAHLPARVFGEGIAKIAATLSRVTPNLMVYVPPRSLLTGEVRDADFTHYLGFATLQALGWSVALLALSSLIFRRRDFL